MKHVWRAPSATGPVHAVVAIPGSKSHTVRALYLAAVASGPSTLRGVLDSRDTRLCMRALTTLGARCVFDEENNERVVHVEPLRVGEHFGGSIDCGLAGTVMRFLPPLAALGSQATRFDGDDAARRRPLAPLCDTLDVLGATVTFEGTKGHLPFTVRGPLRVPKCGCVDVDASESSQFLSSFLLLAPLLGKEVKIRHTGRLISLPHIEMTVQALRQRGCRVDIEGTTSAPNAWTITPSVPNPLDERIEADLSNAGPFLAAAMVTGGRVRVKSWPVLTTQAGDAWRQILPLMGGTLRREGDDLVVQGPERAELKGIDLDMSAIGELAPTVAAICACASTPSTLGGISHLRGHETDRLHALSVELRASGVRVDEYEDGLTIYPGPLRGVSHRAWGDHRMATFAAVLGLRAPGTLLDDIEATSKTFPGFANMWKKMLSGATREDKG